MLEKAAKVVIAPSPSDADLLPLIADADALLIRSTNLTIPVMEAGRKLKVIGRHGIGLDNIDIPAATSLGIQVVNTPGANTNAVAEHALWAMMHCAKNFNRAEQALREGKFSVAGSLPGLVQKFGYSTLELKAKTLGLVGFGRIARRLSELARCLQMDIKAYDPLVTDDAFKAFAVRRVRTVDEAIRDSDFVSLHVPYMKDTHHLIGARELALMKQEAFLLNTSRGRHCRRGGPLQCFAGKENRRGGPGRLREGAAARGSALLRPRERDRDAAHGRHDGPGADQHGPRCLPGDPRRPRGEKARVPGKR